MHEHLPDGTQIHYVITHGGQAAEGAALGTGTTMEYELIHGNYERLINLTLAKLMLDNLKKVGGLDLNEREKAFVREVLANSDFEDREAELNNMLTVRPDLGPVDSIGGTTIGTKSLLNVVKVFLPHRRRPIHGPFESPGHPGGIRVDERASTQEKGYTWTSSATLITSGYYRLPKQASVGWQFD